MSEARITKIESKYNELIEACQLFASESDLKKIEQAYNLAYKAEFHCSYPQKSVSDNRILESEH